MPIRDVLGAILVVALWGVNFVAVKVALGVLPPFLLTSIRFAAVALVLAPFFRPRLEQMPGVAGVGLVLGCGHFGLLFAALSRMDAATAAITTQLGVPISALLAWAFFREKLGLTRAIGMGMAFLGVGVLAGEPSLPHAGPLLLALVSMSCWALSNVQVKRLGGLDPVALNGWMSLFAAPMLLGLSLIFETGQMDALARASTHWPTIAGLAFSVIGSSLVAYTLWYRLIARNPMNRIVPLTMLNPVIGVTGGVLILGEPLSWQKLAGGAITIAGVAVVQLIGGRNTPRELEPRA